MKNLKDILYKTSIEAIKGSTDIAVSKIEFDSRKVSEGDVFVAMRGTVSDGHLYINKCIENGAVVVVCEVFPDEIIEGIVGVEVALDLDLAQAGNDERVLDGAVGHIDREAYGGVAHITGIARGHLHRVRVGALEAVLHDDGVLQAPFAPQLLANDLLQEADVVFFQPFIEEL